MNACAASTGVAGPRARASRRAFIIVAVASVVGGCATPPTTPELPAAGGTPNLWSGRFAVTVSEAGFQPRDERSSGRFSLRTAGDSSRLELSSPLGQTMAQVTLAAGGATLVASDGRVYEAESAEALTEQVFGWRVPLANLPDWLEGRIAEPTERDGSRVVAGLDHGWSVRIDASETGRPRRLALDWPADAGAGERRLSLRLVVDNALRSVARP